ncbi:MAG: nucleotidyltransferase domain-containing protein [Candidatus Hodarchaeota archaeon]
MPENNSEIPEMRIIQEAAEKTAQILKNACIILFGSRSKGNIADTSDWDLLVIAEDFSSLRWLDRWEFCKPLWQLRLPLDVICLTPAETLKAVKNGNPGVCDALTMGSFLTGKRDLFEELSAVLLSSIAKGTISRCAGGWEVFSV